MRWAEYLALIDGARNAYKILVGKSGGKGLLGICRRKNIIKMDLKKIW